MIIKSTGIYSYASTGISRFTGSSILRQLSGGCWIGRPTMSTVTPQQPLPSPTTAHNNNHNIHYHDNNNNQCRYKLIVAYDGTRFHGFQRQIDNDTMMTQYNDKKLLASRRPKKRPHYFDIDTGTTTNTATNTGTDADADAERCAHGEIARIRKGCNISVQEVLELVLLDMYNSPTSSPSTTVSVQDISLTFAGRTDKGVHANGQVCLVHLPRLKQTKDQTELFVSTATAVDIYDSSTSRSYYDYHCWKLRNDMNSRLPLDISIQHVSQLPDATIAYLNPRRDVKLKKYTYTIRYRRCHSPSSTNSASIGSDHEVKMVDHERELHRMIEQGGGPHSIRHATDTYCLWIVPWVLHHDDTILYQLCQQFMRPTPQNFYYFIHKADRDNPKKTSMHTIHEMSYEVIHTSTECISYASLEQPSTTSRSGVSSEIVTGQFTFVAKSFRRTMIRNIVGYCIDACRPNVPNVPSLESLLSSTQQNMNLDSNNDYTTNKIKNRERQPYIISAAPASGLCLESVTY